MVAVIAPLLEQCDCIGYAGSEAGAVDHGSGIGFQGMSAKRLPCHVLEESPVKAFGFYEIP